MMSKHLKLIEASFSIFTMLDRAKAIWANVNRGADIIFYDEEDESTAVNIHIADNGLMTIVPIGESVLRSIKESKNTSGLATKKQLEEITNTFKKMFVQTLDVAKE